MSAFFVAGETRVKVIPRTAQERVALERHGGFLGLVTCIGLQSICVQLADGQEVWCPSDILEPLEP